MKIIPKSVVMNDDGMWVIDGEEPCFGIKKGSMTPVMDDKGNKIDVAFDLEPRNRAAEYMVQENLLEASE